MSAPRHPLSTFKAERLHVTFPPKGIVEAGLMEEALWILRRHFFRSYSDEQWATLKSRVEGMEDQVCVLRRFMKLLCCPYTHYIPVDKLKARQNAIRGTHSTSGISLSRRWLSPSEFTQSSKLYLQQMLWSLKKSLPFLSDNSGSNGSSNSSGAMGPYGPHNPLAPLSFLSNFVTPVLLFSVFRKDLNFEVLKLYKNKGIRPFSKRYLLTFLLVFTCVNTSLKMLSFVRPVRVDMLDWYTSDMNAMTREEGVALSNGFLAKEALLPNDIITHINDKRVPHFSSLKRLQKTLDSGDIGSSSKLSIRRIGRKKSTPQEKEKLDVSHFHAEVTRDPVVTEHVTFKMLPQRQGVGVGYISIDEFTDYTYFEVSNALNALKASQPRKKQQLQLQPQQKQLQAVVIDLRDNPGGTLAAALDIASLFLPRGAELMRASDYRNSAGRFGASRFRKHSVSTGTTTEGVKKEVKCSNPIRTLDTYRSLNSEPDTDTDVLCLINAQTASASEVLVAALQENKRATVMGSVSRGKNVAQALVQLQDGSGLSFTVREYCGPNGIFMGDGRSMRSSRTVGSSGTDTSPEQPPPLFSFSHPPSCSLSFNSIPTGIVPDIPLFSDDVTQCATTSMPTTTRPDPSQCIYYDDKRKWRFVG